MMNDWNSGNAWFSWHYAYHRIVVCSSSMRWLHQDKATGRSWRPHPWSHRWTHIWNHTDWCRPMRLSSWDTKSNAWCFQDSNLANLYCQWWSFLLWFRMQKSWKSTSLEPHFSAMDLAILWESNNINHSYSSAFLGTPFFSTPAFCGSSGSWDTTRDPPWNTTRKEISNGFRVAKS